MDEKNSREYIYHLTTRNELNAARSAGRYTAPSLDAEGFIHCSKASQVADTANLIFQGRTDLVLLCIDPRKVEVRVIYEGAAHQGHAAGTDPEFPHIYGPLNMDAVIDSIDFTPGEDGLFHFDKR